LEARSQGQMRIIGYLAWKAKPYHRKSAGVLGFLIPY
jgi:hypothetical protein